MTCLLIALLSCILSYGHIYLTILSTMPYEIREFKSSLRFVNFYIRKNPSIVLAAVISYAGTLTILWLVFVKSH